ncbi:MAG: RidA family protein [Gammaproteobacteria bacterium]|nr:RidA family protein [Gammaproteobacteria bacterium]
MHQIIETKLAPNAIGPYSQATMKNGLLFVSGQIPIDPETSLLIENDVKKQTRQVLDNLRAIIIEAGMSLENVMKCSCFLSDMENFAAFNEIYSEYFGSLCPARECVEVARLPKDVLVEVSAICME